MSGVIAVLATGRPDLGAIASPEGLTGFKVGAGTVITSQSASVTVIGGTAPYSYVWTLMSGDTQIGPVNGTSSSTKFSAYLSSSGTSYAATYKCVVTDATATSVDSTSIYITMETF